MLRALFAGLVCSVLFGCSSPPRDPFDCGPTFETIPQRKEAILSAHRACTQDADCVKFTDTSVSCYGGCPTALRAGEESAVRTQLDALDGEACTGHGCVAAPGCAPVGDVQCLEGTCVLPSGFPTGNCQVDQETVGRNVQYLIAAHRDGCTQDADCALVSTDVSCQSGCEASLLADAGTAVRTQLDALDAELCSKIPDCFSSGTCAAYDRAICFEGACRHGYADGGLAW